MFTRPKLDPINIFFPECFIIMYTGISLRRTTYKADSGQYYCKTLYEADTSIKRTLF